MMTILNAADRENRTVNDFDTPEELAQALMSMNLQRSSTDSAYVSFRRHALDESSRETSSLDLADKKNSPTSAATAFQPLDPKLDWVLDNYDQNSCEAQSLEEELQRLLVLKSYLMLDEERKEAFERVTGLASRIFKCPMALISLVDIGRQWFMSNRGLGGTRETPRKFAFCAHAIMAKEDFLIVPDATKDFRFRENPLVTGPPHIRFYAGAPLISPEGYKLGTLCVLDRSPRPNGISMEEKQNLMELAALAVQSAVDHKKSKLNNLNDPAQMIAYTAHDLLTPLTGVQLSLSLLAEDEEFKSKLTAQQREMITTATNCTDMMGRICQTAMDSFRKSKQNHSSLSKSSKIRTSGSALTSALGPATSLAPIEVSKLVSSLYMVLNPFPKKVPMAISVHPETPETIVTDELKVFRSAVNFLTNACAKTTSGMVQLSIRPISEDGGNKLLFECEDTGPGVPVEMYPRLFKPVDDEEDTWSSNSCMIPSSNGGFEAISRINTVESGLGLYSVAVHIASLAGEYGFRPRGEGKEPQSNEKPITGSVFWFKIPLIIPSSTDKDGPKFSNPMFSTIHEQTIAGSAGYDPTTVKVLSTPSLSSDVANQLYDAFTKVLESDFTPRKVETIDDSDEHVTAAEQEGCDVVKMKEAVPVPSGQERKKKALVIEDSLVVRKSLTRVLNRLGYETAQAVDGMEGLKELQCALFDVVFCDFLMPVMDGLDCVQQYRDWEAEHRPFFRQHIVGISAHAGENDIAKGIEAGMDDFRPKPVTFKQLADLQSSEKLKIIGRRLDEIAATGTLMVDVETGDQTDAVLTEKGSEAFSTDSPAGMTNRVSDTMSNNTSIHFCLVAIDEGKVDLSSIESSASKRGWKTVMVHDGEDALRLMKMRNWDLVMLDEELPILQCMQCVARFREWEEKNRVNRQRNIVLLSASSLSTVVGSKSMVQLPFGFDVTLGKPIRSKEFEYLMAQAERAELDFGVRDFVSR